LIIVGKHRSAALAARHLSALKRQYPDSRVELIARRNGAGRYSSSGHFFWYEVTKLEEKIELVLHFDYASPKDSRLLRFQVHVTAPGATDDDEAIEVVRQHFTSKKKWPKGWRQRSIYWGHVLPGTPEEVRRKYDPEEHAHIRRITFAGGEGTVTSRRAIKKNRRPEKRKATK
jgi:hypothetical protein